MPMIPLLIGAGMGLLNASEQDKQASADRERAAATIAMSPYTGASIDKAQASIHPAKYIASTGAGALAGLAASQGNASSLLGGGPTTTINNNNSNAMGASAADSFKGLAAPENSFWNKPPELSAKKKGVVGGEYGFGPPPNTFEEVDPKDTGYGAPWGPSSPYWNKNPYGSS